MSRPGEAPQARTPQRRNGKLRVAAILKAGAAVIAEKAQGQAAGVSGTPTSFINGTKVQGFKDYPTMAALITAAVPGASPARTGAAGSLSPSAGPSTSP